MPCGLPKDSLGKATLSECHWGSLGGTPFDLVGIDSLGSQTFLQSFCGFQLPTLNGFDHVYCFLVSGLLINDIGRKSGLHWFLRVLSILVFVFVNSQYVNVSALYSGTLFVLAAVYSSLLLAEAYQSPARLSEWRNVVALGLVVAGLITLKVTFLVFATIYVLLFFIMCVWVVSDRKRVVKAAFLAVNAIMLTLLPWMIGIGDKLSYFENELVRKVGGLGDGVSMPNTKYELDIMLQHLLFEKSFYGGYLVD